MFNRMDVKKIVTPARLATIKTGLLSATFLFLVIEFFDELVYGVQGAALPALRSDLGLTYAQVGLLLGGTSVVSVFIEPLLLLLGDTSLRKMLVVAGGLAIAVAMLLVAGAAAFAQVLLAMIISFPASGAFVTLVQATLMDLNPGREPHTMARWTLAGSLGNLIGPLLLAAGFAMGWGWRWAYAGLAIMGLGLVLQVIRRPFPVLVETAEGGQAPHTGSIPASKSHSLLGGLWEAVRNPRLLRWIILLQFSDLMLDIFTNYLALYLVDVAGLSHAGASILLGLATVASLGSDLLLVVLLERFPGRSIVRLSAGLVACLYAAWLIVPSAQGSLPVLTLKIVLLLAIKLGTLGWYSVLQGEAYASVPGRSGTVTAVGSVAGLLTGGLSWLVGWTAARAGLQAAMWLLLLGPLSLLFFLPRTGRQPQPGET